MPVNVSGKVVKSSTKFGLEPLHLNRGHCTHLPHTVRQIRQDWPAAAEAFPRIIDGDQCPAIPVQSRRAESAAGIGLLDGSITLSDRRRLGERSPSRWVQQRPRIQ